MSKRKCKHKHLHICAANLLHLLYQLGLTKSTTPMLTSLAISVTDPRYSYPGRLVYNRHTSILAARPPRMDKRHPQVRPLLTLLYNLGVKSAKVGLNHIFIGGTLFRPGAYTNANLTIPKKNP